MSDIFVYGEKELTHLKSHDKKLGAVIDKIGMLSRETERDLFSGFIHQIIGQQISMKAAATVISRFDERFGSVYSPEVIAAACAEEIQSLGISRRKADYIRDFARKVSGGGFSLSAIEKMSDSEAIKTLCTLNGCGEWTAEMLLLFCLRRPDILSFKDAGIQRGMRMVYGHKEITRQLFEKYRKRLSPYGSTASLYFWAVSGGAIPEMCDPHNPQVGKKC